MKLTTEFKIGAVIIGRNEGDNLVTCLNSLIEFVDSIVYVDSGSTDNSIHNVKLLGLDVVQLDLSTPFTAARARNEGFAYLLKKEPGTKYVQFVDGDCEVQASWLEKAIEFLESHLSYAAVCGRRRERYPERSIYNQLCDIEWNTPVGSTLACGGDALFRVKPFKQVAGYNSTLIAGEEPELCFRLRAKDWKIMRLDVEMTLHDANMTTITQWWNRAKRSGHAYASSCFLHGSAKERFKVRDVASILLWSLVIPLVIVSCSLYHIFFIGTFLIYPVQLGRLTIKHMVLKKGWGISIFYAASNILAKFPQFFGLLNFAFNKFKGVQAKIIEYK